MNKTYNAVMDALVKTAQIQNLEAQALPTTPPYVVGVLRTQMLAIQALVEERNRLVEMLDHICAPFAKTGT